MYIYMHIIYYYLFFYFSSGGEGLETDPDSVSGKVFFPAQSGMLSLWKVIIEQLV